MVLQTLFDGFRYRSTIQRFGTQTVGANGWTDERRIPAPPPGKKLLGVEVQCTMQADFGAASALVGTPSAIQAVYGGSMCQLGSDKTDLTDVDAIRMANYRMTESTVGDGQLLAASQGISTLTSTMTFYVPYVTPGSPLFKVRAGTNVGLYVVAPTAERFAFTLNAVYVDAAIVPYDLYLQDAQITNITNGSISTNLVATAAKKMWGIFILNDPSSFLTQVSVNDTVTPSGTFITDAQVFRDDLIRDLSPIVPPVGDAYVALAGSAWDSSKVVIAPTFGTAASPVVVTIQSAN
jgi:hypothetical protein